MNWLLLQADCKRGLPLADGSVHCVVTSPPYFGLRDYGIDGQIGLEETPEAFVAALVDVFREVRRVLRDDGTCWVNMGDSYNSAAQSNKNGSGASGLKRDGRLESGRLKSNSLTSTHMSSSGCGKGVIRAGGLKSKDLIGVPWMLAFALRADGWYLRSDVVWCLSGGTWVYAKTQKGEMPMMISDMVRLDPATVKLWNGSKWTQVKGWNRSHDPREKLELVLRSGERIGCTGNHQWPTQRGNIVASELLPGDVISSCVLPESPTGGRPQYLTDDALWFVGLYLAEGSMADDTIQISGHADEMHRVARIEAVAKHYGGTATHTLDGNNLSIRVYSRVLRAILETYIGGRKAEDKHLKVATWSLPYFSLRFVLQGYLEGDGHDDAANDRIRLGFCRNYALERDLRTAAARLGATLTLKPVVVTNQRGKFPAFNGEWRWNRSGHRNEKDRGEIISIGRSKGRHFWDIGVEDEPHLFALASGVLTHNSKPNPMRESVRDRPTKAHEYLFLLAKQERYFYDVDAIREKAKQQAVAVYNGNRRHDDLGRRGLTVGTSNPSCTHPSGSNKLSVWNVATSPLKAAHFATFPPKLITPCIKAGTSAKGCCPKCGAPWRRILKKKRVATRPGVDSKVYATAPVHPDSPLRSHSGDICGNRDPKRHVTATRTVGWESSCGCLEARHPVPCTVFDPFGGAGTTPMVATLLGRNGIACDLNADYLAMAARRIARAHRPVSKLDPAPARAPLTGQLSLFDQEAP